MLKKCDGLAGLESPAAAPLERACFAISGAKPPALARSLSAENHLRDGQPVRIFAAPRAPVAEDHAQVIRERSAGPDIVVYDLIAL